MPLYLDVLCVKDEKIRFHDTLELIDIKQCKGCTYWASCLLICLILRKM